MIKFEPYVHHGKDLEEGILGACLLEKLAFGRTYGLLDAECFYFKGHEIVYEAMREMYDNSLPIDIFTVSEYVIAQKRITEIDGGNVPYFVTKLTNSVVSTAHLEYHCHLVKEMWRRRMLIELKYQPIDDFDPRANIREMNKELNRIVSTEFKQDWYDMEELMYNLMLHQQKMVSGEKTFITTGFKHVDQRNGGFYNGQMIIIGARPSVGKSALMGQMAIKMAQTGKKVGIISLEMNNNEIAARLSSLDTGIDFNRIFRDIMNDEQLHRRFYDRIRSSLVNLPIYLSDKTKVNVNEIKAKAIKLKATKGCDCLIIDYLQLLDGEGGNKGYNREQEVAKMSRGLKMMAGELDIPVLVLCQLNRAITHRQYKDRFPRLSDLRESGSIEQDADVVLFIHRDKMAGFDEDASGNSTENTADLIGAKWRNGATFHLPLEFDPPKMKFTEKAHEGFTGYQPVSDFQDDNPF